MAMNDQEKLAPGGLAPCEVTQTAAAAPAVVADPEREAHLAAARARLAGGFPHAAARTAIIEQRFPASERAEHYARLSQLATREERIVWLRHGADRTLQAASGVSACTRGCAHCCHIPVLISEPEAQLIGREIGRAPVEGAALARAAPSAHLPALKASPGGAATLALRRLQSAIAERYTGRACTFLSSAGECTIYTSRPLACRRVINVDDDALLCRLVPGVQLGPAYLDQRIEHALEVQAVGPGCRVADLRDWFPPAPDTV